MAKQYFNTLRYIWGVYSVYQQYVSISNLYVDGVIEDDHQHDPNKWFLLKLPSTVTFEWGVIADNNSPDSAILGIEVSDGDEVYRKTVASDTLPALFPIPYPDYETVNCSLTTDLYERKHTQKTISVKYYIEAKYTSSPSVFRYSEQIEFTVPAKPSYSVSFDANGGTGAPNSQTKWYAENLAISSAVPAYSGYSFKRWNTNANDTGTAYNPGATYTANAALSLYAIWNRTVTYDANGGSGAPSSQTGVKTSAMTLSSSVPTRSGWRFVEWNTESDGSGTSYLASSSYSANLPDVILYAQWERILTGVKINSAVIKRVDSPTSTTESDEGEYARIEVPYTIEGSAAADVSLSVSVVPDHGDIPTVTFIDGTSTKSEGANLSGTFTAVAATCYQDIRYSFSITVTAENTSASQADVSRTETIILAMAFFTMDFLAGGHGVGIGKPATREMFDVGMQAQFDKPLKIAETDVPPTFYYQTKPSDPLDLPVRPCIVIQTSDWSVWYCDNATPPSYHQLTDNTKVSKSGDTMTGALITKDVAHYAKSTSIDTDGSAPSTDQSRSIAGARDKDDVTFAYVEGSHQTNGNVVARLASHRVINGTNYYNAIVSMITSSGESTYGVSNSKNFRSAIGAMARTSETKSGSNLNNMSNGEIWWGNNLTNAPGGATGYFRVERFADTQVAFLFTSNTTAPYVYVRTYINNVWQPWAMLWNSEKIRINAQVRYIDIGRSTTSNNVWIDIVCTDGKTAELVLTAS